MNITKSLQETLLANSGIDSVHFDAKDKHYFNIFELQDKKDSENYKKYGTGIFSHSQVIPGATNVDKVTEPISIGKADTEIVKTMSREEVLSVQVVDESNDIVSQVLSLPPAALAALKAALNSVPESKEEKVTAIPTVKKDK